MSTVGFEIIFILLLLVANGVFAMSELALVSARKARLQQRANAGDMRARAALELANATDTFLSTAQIGITLVGIRGGGNDADPVPISQSLRAFNLLAAPQDRFTEEEIEYFTREAQVPNALRSETQTPLMEE